MSETSPTPRFQQLDVRPVMERGEEPYRAIMPAVAALRENEGLELTTPFLPSPLIERMQSAGYQTRAERQLGGEWLTFFWRD